MIDEFLFSRWQHKKTGHDYVIIGRCQLESTNKLAFLYVREDDPFGTPWARDADEFLDGRFQHLEWKNEPK